MTDPRSMYRQALDQTGTIVAGVRPDQFGLMTPCEGWNVRTLLSHMVGVVTRAALTGEGVDAPVFPAFVHAETADWLAAYSKAADRALAAWADDGKLEALFAVPWGKVPGRGAVTGYAEEILTHGWDLATATGQETERDPALAEFALEFAQRSIPPEIREQAPFGLGVEPPPDVGPYMRLAVWLGRTPPATAG
jgi:uncharacterized protein (TIGR03086 family)